ncbi:MAG: hypothetical protein HGA31_00835 [Candidatus Moranbacteria bacterium]|nr:hypothetical protein [Candidatus Moranbacteria bacterium]
MGKADAIADIQYIGTAMDSALKQNAENPRLSKETIRQIKEGSVRKVAGFHIRDKSSLQSTLHRASSRAAEQIDGFRRTCDKISVDMATRGLKPALAFVSTKTWKRICDESGLYRFKPVEGLVKVSRQPLERMRSRAESLSSLLIRLMVPAIVFAISWEIFTILPPDAKQGGPKVIAGILSILTGVIIWLILSIVFDEDLASSLKERLASFCTILQIKMFSVLPNRLTFKGLFPDMEEAGDSNCISAEIKLPDPPEDEMNDVATTILAAKDLGLKVAAVPGAVTFVGGIQNALLRRETADHAIRLSEIEKRREARRLDPIIYHEREGVVAIIAQFGNIPIEKKVVERIMNDRDII